MMVKRFAPALVLVSFFSVVSPCLAQRSRAVPHADLIERVAPGFTTGAVGEDGLELVAFAGRPRVLRTHPVSEDEPCTLRRRLDVPGEGKTRLLLDVAPDPQGDWRLVVKADGRVLHDSIVNAASLKAGWAHVEADLAPFAGRSVVLELENRANGWSWEFGYWGRAEVSSTAR